ncbi:MAG: PfkB family carbohydrate kinase [Puniceicoccales bacterium]|jgi:sugar/nucleoside kinase (ribokinase family)|nr:PfkB family carbohydrate kinase [Puniceicoccales bacterium]
MQRISLSTATVPAPLLVTGSIAYDDIETPRGNGENLLGGSASYASIAASYFTDVHIVGVVGTDFRGGDRTRLSARGIAMDGLHQDCSGQTFHWRGKYHENYNQRDTLDVSPGVFSGFLPTLPPACRTIPYVLLSNITPALQWHVLSQVQSPRFVLLDTMDLWIETAHADLLRILPRADILIVNDSEARSLGSDDNLIRAGQTLRQMGARAVIVKKGEHGALLFHPDGLFALPAHPVIELHDPTGAGDSFAGALAGTLAALQRTDFAACKLAMLYATALASLTVEAFSCDRLESAGIAEIEERASNIRQMIALD